ncbi:hypothetical protein LMG7974_01925 [Campylobacter majalis]|uniref:Lipoprotein n=1 Tax=Campylobacter majalis TaxID=2790656 RepID=A0ABM8QAP0_9BACT|nr:hypothetical protein [Campylobacter majalis]CAD7289840.1 hypothetical protein LMG7974_01925 [Campylobacter majalis]
MIAKKIFLMPFVLLVLSGCHRDDPSYEIFKSNNDINIGNSFIPTMNSKTREIYDKDRYIYKFEGPKGCRYGFLTNRDDKPEVLQEWIILSGKEYCKEKRGWVLIQ